MRASPLAAIAEPRLPAADFQPTAPPGDRTPALSALWHWPAPLAGSAFACQKNSSMTPDGPVSSARSTRRCPVQIGVQAPHTGPRPHRHQNPANALRPSVRGLFRPRLPNAPPLRTPSCKPPESPPPASKLQVGALPIGCSSMRFLLRLDYVHAVFHVPGSRNKNLNQLRLRLGPATKISEMRPASGHRSTGHALRSDAPRSHHPLRRVRLRATDT